MVRKHLRARRCRPASRVRWIGLRSCRANDGGTVQRDRRRARQSIQERKGKLGSQRSQNPMGAGDYGYKDRGGSTKGEVHGVSVRISVQQGPYRMTFFGSLRYQALR